MGGWFPRWRDIPTSEKEPFFTVIDPFAGFDNADNREDLLARLHAAAEGTHRPGAFLITSHTDLRRETDIPCSTLSGYLDLLERLFTFVMVPGWTPGLGAEEIQRPLAFLPDAGLAAYLDGADDPLAHVLATLHRQSAWSRDHYRVYHYRNSNGRCGDCVVELADGRVIGVQVTSARRILVFSGRTSATASSRASCATSSSFLQIHGGSACKSSMA
ncbi:hypothetical protein BJF89_14415 [Corynebacterium sp. CNJ-954]|uniref:DUF4143 domain-containing protein n=1 Tax=Corynebacterium sp. CNJ-954 TaxID=1904962 RepID=UPI00095E3135|nr:DUF4143 domain-containing protein [Corynebacterium sp. CNJ-954]OLT55689.1 hypothetical protein BJF89_14415 [Corynebacterium sp. CNJ-954]